MRRLKQMIFAFAVAMAAFVSLWIAAVRAVPGVRRRKAATRAARGA